MLIHFEKVLTGEEAAKILLDYPHQARFLEIPDEISGLPNFNEVIFKCRDIDRDDPGHKPLRYVREMSEERALRMVRENPGAIQFLTNPTPEIRKAAGLDASGAVRPKA